MDGWAHPVTQVRQDQYSVEKRPYYIRRSPMLFANYWLLLPASSNSLSRVRVIFVTVRWIVTCASCIPSLTQAYYTRMM